MEPKVYACINPFVCSFCKQIVKIGDWAVSTKPPIHHKCFTAHESILKQVKKSHAKDSTLKIPVPPGKELRPFQKAGIEYVLQRDRALIGDEMGLGKTVQAICVVNKEDIKTVLVICPKSMIVNWVRAFFQWCTKPITPEIVNYEQIYKQNTDQSWDYLIVDECHFIKNPGSARSIAVRDIAKRCKRIVMLSGTPVPNRIIDLWPVVQILAPEVFDPPGFVKGRQVGAGEGAGYYAFANRYCGPITFHFGKKRITRFMGATNLEELQEKLRAHIMVRRLKKDVLPELPPKQREIVVLPSEPGELQHERDAWSILGLTYEETLDKLTTQKIKFEDISRVRKETAWKKRERLLTHIQDALLQTKKIIVFVHHTDLAIYLFERLHFTAGARLIIGETPQSDRTKAQDNFQNREECEVIIGSIGAMGVGLTLTAASLVIFGELSWRPDELSQAEDRAHRIGQKSFVLVQHCVIDGSIDANMAELIIKKQETIDKALDSKVVPGLGA